MDQDMLLLYGQNMSIKSLEPEDGHVFHWSTSILLVSPMHRIQEKKGNALESEFSKFLSPLHSFSRL